MRKIVLFFVVILLFIAASTAQQVPPSFDTEIERSVKMIDIEGVQYNNAVIKFDSNIPDGGLINPAVKVTVVDTNGKVIWKKRIRKCFLFIYSDGQIEVGANNVIRVLVTRDYETGMSYANIRLKEGIF